MDRGGAHVPVTEDFFDRPEVITLLDSFGSESAAADATTSEDEAA